MTINFNQQIFNQNLRRIISALLLVLFVVIEGRSQTSAPVNIKSNLSDTLTIAKELKGIDSVLVNFNNETEAGTKLTALFDSMTDSTSKAFFVDQAGRKGIAHRQKYAFNFALFWHQQQLIFARKTANGKGLVTALNNLGLLYRRMDRYANSIEAYQQALTISDSIGYERGYVFATNGLGNIYLTLDNFNEALRNFRECLRVEQKTSNLTGVAINLNNIGHVYLNQNLLDQALEYFMLSLEVNREMNNKRGTAICYNDMGEIYLRKGDDAKALNYYLLSLQLNTSVDDLYYLSINNLKLAEIYMRSAEYDKALTYLKESVRLAVITNNRAVLKDAYKFMYKVYKHKGNIVEAISFLEQSTILNDSILNENTQKVIYQMQATFNREQTDNKIALLKNEKQLADLRIRRQNLYNTMVMIGLFLSIVLIFVVLYVIRMVNNKNKLLKARNAEIEHARDQLKEYADKLLVAKQEAEQSNRLKSQFLANMSHEIRTPMNSVIGFTEILTKLIDDPKQLDYLESIKLSGQSLLVLINDILDLSKIEAGKIEIQYRPLDYFRLLEEVRKVFEPQCLQKNLVFVVEMDRQVPRTIHFSESSLRQILFNLIGNAIKFTSGGTVKIKTKMTFPSNSESEMFIEVSDTGQGMDKDDLEYIFEAFYQTSLGKDQLRGTGLGLTITKRLVEAMGGTIKARSSRGEGTVFSIWFPNVSVLPDRTHLKRFDEENAQQGEWSSICLISNNLRMKTRIDLLVEKSGSICDVFQDFTLLLKYRKHWHYRLMMVDVSALHHFEIAKENGLFNERREHSKLAFVFLEASSEQERLNELGLSFHLPVQNSGLLALVKEASKDTRLKQADKLLDDIIFDAELEEVRQLSLNFIRAQKTQYINDVAFFASSLIDLAEKLNHDALLSFGLELEKHTDSFNIEQISNLLNQFETGTNILDISTSM